MFKLFNFLKIFKYLSFHIFIMLTTTVGQMKSMMHDLKNKRGIKNEKNK